MRSEQPLGIDAFVANTMRLNPNITPLQALMLLQSCLRQVVIAVLLVVPAGSYSLLPINTSSGLGPIPLTFSPRTGKINSNLPVDVLLIAVNLGLVIFRALSYLLLAIAIMSL